MAPLSDKKLRIIKRRYGQKSIAEIAKELNLKEKDVRIAIRSLGLETAKQKGGAAGALEIALGDHSDRWMLAAAIVVVVLTAISFGGSTKNPMLFDDHHSILDNNYIRVKGYMARFFVDPNMFSNEPERRMYRPLVLLTYALNYAISEYNPAYWHALNLLFHSLNGFLVFLIFDMLFKSRRVALVFAALFVVHPAVSESVIYLSARSTLMAGTFIFGVIYSFLRQAKAGGGWRWVAIMSSCYLAGLLCKENVFMLTPIFLVLEWLFGTRPSDFVSTNRWKAHASIWGISIVYLLFRKFGLSLPTAVLSRPERPFYSQVLTQTGVWLAYLSKMLWPIGLNTQPRVEFVKNLWIPGHGIAGQPAIWLLMWAPLIALVVAGRRNKLIMLGVAFAAIILLPETLTAMNQVYNERRIYLPLFGMIIAGGGIFGAVTTERFKQFIFYLLIVIVVCMVPIGHKRVLAWSSEKKLWFDSIAKAPNSEVSWHGLGYVYGQDGEAQKDRTRRVFYFYKALWALNHALAIDNNFPPSLRLVGALLLTLEKPREALPYLERAAQREPLSHKGWYNLALCKSQLGDIQGAIESYKKSISMNQFYDQPHNNLGIIYASQGKYEEALKEVREAIRLNPTNADYQSNLQELQRNLQGLRSKPPPGEPHGPVIIPKGPPH